MSKPKTPLQEKVAAAIAAYSGAAAAIETDLRATLSPDQVRAIAQSLGLEDWNVAGVRRYVTRAEAAAEAQKRVAFDASRSTSAPRVAPPAPPPRAVTPTPVKVAAPAYTLAELEDRRKRIVAHPLAVGPRYETAVQLMCAPGVSVEAAINLLRIAAGLAPIATTQAAAPAANAPPRKGPTWQEIWNHSPAGSRARKES